MKKGRNLLVTLLLSFIVFGSVGLGQTENPEKAAIIETVKNYVEGGYAADADRMQKALWPELYKAIPYNIPKSSVFTLYTNTYSQLIENVRVLKPDMADTKIKIEVEAINQEMASVKATSKLFNEFMHVLKLNGEWKIINVLWTDGEDSPRRNKSLIFDAEKEKPAIEKTALDYIDGFFEGNKERMTEAVHPEINKVAFRVLPKSGRGFISKMGSSMLIGYTEVKAGLTPPEKRNIKVKILNVMDGMASVEIESATLWDYVQMAKMGDKWKIISVLWKGK